MSSELLGSAQNVLKGNLGGAWDITNGYQDAYTDLGIARRFGGAAAAYSLRDIGAMNGRVVKVRRDVDGDGTDKEEDFSANQVSSGALEDWVNGKLENTLPADVATAAAAYSLRKVKSDYGIPVTEVNGTDGFPATITLSPQTITGTSFTVRKFSNGSPDSSEATAVNGVYRVSATKTSTASFSKVIRIQGLEDGKQYTVKGEFRMVEDTTSGGDSAAVVDISDDTAGTDEDAVSTTSTTFVPFFIDSGYNSGSSDNWVDFAVVSVGSEAGTITAEFRNVQIIENNNSAVRIRRSSDDEEVVVGFDADNKVSASSPVTATPRGSTSATTFGDFISGTDAFVHTWYDQAGVNNAVQETYVNQPKIAEGGALLDGINFNANTDGTSPDFLQVATRLGVTTDHFISAVFNGYQTDGSAFGAIINTRNGNAGYQYGIAATDNVQAFFYAGAGNNANSSSSFALSNNSAKRLVTFDKDGNNLTGFGNAATNGISLSNGVNTPSTTVTNIGVGGNVGTTTSLGLRANINELIVYETDQADNRFKIESNINNYYGLYTFQGDGFVQTWYDQSGNGRDATQGTAANQPTIVQNGGLSSDGLDFDGSNDLLDITNSLPITGANARSVFAVVNKDVSSSSDNILGIGDNGSGVNSQLWNLATTYGLYYNGGNTVFGAGSLNTEQLITAIYPSTATDSGDTVFFIDGSASSITSNVDTTLATDNTVARIGSGGGSAGGLLNGSLEEIIVFDSDKLSDRTDIEQDIKNFYNI